MTIDTKNLRTLAEAATPGPWTIHTEEVMSPIVAAMELSKLAHGSVFTPVLPMVVGSNDLCTAVTGCGPTGVSNAAYIAACSPDVVLALLDALERKDRVLREALEAIEIAKNGLDWFKDSYPHDVNESDAEASEQINEAIEAITKELAP